MFHIQGHSKDFWYNMGYASKRLEMNFHLYTMGFNAFQLSWKMFMNSVCLSVCLSVRRSVRALTLVNILRMFWNLEMLLISDIEWSVLKILCMGLKVHLQRHTKVFRCITAFFFPSLSFTPSFVSIYVMYGLKVRLQRHTKVFRCITTYGGIFKSSL